jgi:hypothetical protein
LRGERGERGPRGEQGLQGERGEEGVPGPQGKVGNIDAAVRNAEKAALDLVQKELEKFRNEILRDQK